MGFGKNIGRRDDYITCSNRSAQGAAAYDDDGRLIPLSQNLTTIEFWGDIADVRSNPDVLAGGRKNVRQIIITCDSRDVDNLTIDFTLTFAGSDKIYQIKDIYDSNFRFTKEIIAEYQQ